MVDERAVELSEGTTVGGEFRVATPLRRGGNATIYVARQLSTGKMRALKVPRPGLALDVARDDFRYEAQVTARIESAHVVDVVGAGVDPSTGMPFIAMELLRGHDLAHAVELCGRLSEPRALELFRHLGHALRDAHALGIVHRDLKPENVVLAEARHSGAPFTAKLVDFGAARRCVGRPRRQTRAIGSPYFMAPEQTIERATIDARTDVWGFALLAFFAMTGRYFWLGTTMERVLDEVLASPVPPASERAFAIGAELPDWPGLDGWFARCLDRDPARRFADGGIAARLLLEMGEAAAAEATTLSPRDWVFESGTWPKAEAIVAATTSATERANTIPAPPSEALAEVPGGIG